MEKHMNKENTYSSQEYEYMGKFIPSRDFYDCKDIKVLNKGDVCMIWKILAEPDNCKLIDVALANDKALYVSRTMVEDLFEELK